MKVQLLNAEEVNNIFSNWGKVASVCYDTKTDAPEKIGKHCMNSGHTSGSRGDYFKFLVTDVPRFTVDQAVRHSVGTFMNVGSFRYIDKDNFAYEIPDEILDSPEMVNQYEAFMVESEKMYESIQKYVLNKTQNTERANESARYVLPMATHTSFVMGFTVEALIHFMNMRLCVRAEDKIRELALLMKKAVVAEVPELEKKLVPNCEALLWCPEGKKGCGAYPTKKELRDLINSCKNR